MYLPRFVDHVAFNYEVVYREAPYMRVLAYWHPPSSHTHTLTHTCTHAHIHTGTHTNT